MAWGFLWASWKRLQPQFLPKEKSRGLTLGGQQLHKQLLRGPVAQHTGQVPKGCGGQSTVKIPEAMQFTVVGFAVHDTKSQHSWTQHQARVADLWDRFLVSQGSHEVETGSTVEEKFGDKLSLMLRRELLGEVTGQRTCVARRDQNWAVPDSLYSLLQLWGVTVEWFANPLNYSLCFPTHFTACLEDQCWGLQYDAYHGANGEIRQWELESALQVSPVDHRQYLVHMAVANPPYLAGDLTKKCAYAEKACQASVPVRIWSVLPTWCQEELHLRAKILQAGGNILVEWPQNSFVFVPDDFWVGTNYFKVKKATTAPFPVMLVVFHNAAARNLFPVDAAQLQMLMIWTRTTLGKKGMLD